MLESKSDRRRFLQRAALSATLPWWASVAMAQEKTPGGLIYRFKDPDNLEFPFETLNSFKTPNEKFYIRNHFAVPQIEAAKWKLEIGGAVDKPLSLTYDQLLAMPAKTIPMTLECAGNGRTFLQPQPKGLLWDLGAVGTAEWTGVPLTDVLERAGVKKEAVEVILEGVDRGELKNDPKPPGVVSFTRSLPLAKARKPEVLLAYKMNGEVLPPSHGFPIRVVVGGWYGMCSIKWLQRILVSATPFMGYYQSYDYTTWQRQEGLATLVPITEMAVKSSIARPQANETIPAGKPYRIHGAAWTGEADITRVEVSTDGGKTWGQTKLLGEAIRHCWRLWEFPWSNPQPGKAVLLSRATDSRGRVQPVQHDPDRGRYVINFTLPTPIEVR